MSSGGVVFFSKVSPRGQESYQGVVLSVVGGTVVVVGCGRCDCGR